MKKESFAPGKIILSGEYAVVFGHPGVAVPSPIGMNVTFKEKLETDGIEVVWPDMPAPWSEYLNLIIDHCRNLGCDKNGTLKIDNELPLGKGMGSSTSLMVAVSRCLLGENCRDLALAIEDSVNPGHSGVDFNVIWMNSPILFMKGQKVEKIDLDLSILKKTFLIDTGKPGETTSELINWISERKDELNSTFKKIADCTHKITKLVSLSGVEGQQALIEIIKEHHKAQVELGVVPENVQELVDLIENSGGAAKVIGAGGRENKAGPAHRSPKGAGGMVLAIGISEPFLKDQSFPYFSL